MLKRDILDTVLFVSCDYVPPKGGIAQVVYNYSRYIFRHFKCVTNTGEGNKAYKIWKFLWGVLSLVVMCIYDRNIRIVHIHTASNVSFKRSAYFVHIARLFHKKVILHIHGGAFKEYYQRVPAYVTGVLNLCDCIVVLSDSWKHFFEGICQVKVVVVNNVIEPPHKQEKKEDGFIHLLFMGLLVKEKGIYDLLDVIAVHHEELSHLIKLHIGGNGDVASLLRYIKEHELNDCVIYEGWVSGEKKSRLLSQCDIYVLPSYIEGLPLSILEAMSYGCPIMATEVGGIPEIVWNGKNGFLIKPGDKNGMYDRLSRLIQDDILRARMGEDARERALNNSPQSVKKELLTVYNQLLKN